MFFLCSIFVVLSFELFCMMDIIKKFVLRNFASNRAQYLDYSLINADVINSEKYRGCNFHEFFTM